MAAYYGTIQSFDADKGFGFIDLADFPEEETLFFHVSALDYQMDDIVLTNQKVTFDIAEGKNGPQAVNMVIQ